jgi:hypothetical protein
MTTLTDLSRDLEELVARTAPSGVSEVGWGRTAVTSTAVAARFGVSADGWVRERRATAPALGVTQHRIALRGGHVPEPN